MIHDYHGFGGHSIKRQTMTSQFDGVVIVESIGPILEQNCWKFTSTNSCSTNTHVHFINTLHTHHLTSTYLVYTVDHTLSSHSQHQLYHVISCSL